MQSLSSQTTRSIRVRLYHWQFFSIFKVSNLLINQFYFHRVLVNVYSVYQLARLTSTEQNRSSEEKKITCTSLTQVLQKHKCLHRLGGFVSGSVFSCIFSFSSLTRTFRTARFDNLSSSFHRRGSSLTGTCTGVDVDSGRSESFELWETSLISRSSDFMPRRESSSFVTAGCKQSKFSSKHSKQIFIVITQGYVVAKNNETNQIAPEQIKSQVECTKMSLRKQ